MNSTTSVSPELRAQVVSQYQLDDSKPEARFDEIVESVAKSCGVSAAMLIFAGNENTVVKSTYGIDVPSRALDQSLVVSQIISPLRTIVFNDITKADPGTYGLIQEAGFGQIQSLAGLPLVAPNGVALGAFALMDFAPHDFTMVQIEALARASRRVVELLESNKMAAELVAAKAAANYADNSKQIVSELVDEMLKNHGWWAARSYWVDEGQLHAEPWRFETVAPQSIRKLAEQNGAQVIIDDVLKYPKPTLKPIEQATWLGDLEPFKRAGVRNIVVLDIAGVLAFALRLVFVVPNTQALTPDITASLATASLLLPKVIRQERARAELHYRATHDALTGMLNRRGLEQVVEPIEQTPSGAVHAVVYMDIDRFKSVNDTHGHAVGDEVLSHVTADLVRQIRPTDVLARLGGDEFLLLALNVTDLAGAKAAAERILGQVNGAFRTKTGLEIPVSVSMGLSLWRAGDSFQDALRVSDALMYRAKQQGGGLYVDEAEAKSSNVSSDAVDFAALGSSPQVVVRPVLSVESSSKSEVFAEVQGGSGQTDSRQIAKLVSTRLKAFGSAEASGLLVQFPNNYWTRGGLIEDIVGDLKRQIPSTEVAVVIDCSLANPSVRQTAMQLKKRANVELLLANFGSGPNELVMLEQLAPVALGLATEAVASLGTLEPMVNSLKTGIAIAAALGLRTVAFHLNSESQREQLTQLGCDEFIFVQQQSKGK